MNKRKGFAKSIAFTLVMAMLFATLSFGGMAGLPGVGGVEAYGATATTPEEAQTATLNGYYLTERNGILADWEEVAAVKASGGNLEDFVLPDYNTGTPSTTVLYALIRGDITSAGITAETLVSSGLLNTTGDAINYSLDILAIEAFNRSVDESLRIVYSTSEAISNLLALRDGNGIFLDPWMDQPGGDYAGMAMVALSLFKGDGSTVDMAIEQCKLQIQNVQGPDGAFVGSFGNANANTTALIIYGIMAADPNNIHTYTTGGGMSPIDGLLSFYVNGGGFDYDDKLLVNAYASKQATLALADIVSGRSFLASLTAGGIHYTDTKTQVIDSSGQFHELNSTGIDRVSSSGDSIDKAIKKALGFEEEIDFNDYKVFLDGSLVTDNNLLITTSITDVNKILAVHNNYNKAVYFVDGTNSEFGVANVKISNGASHNFTLMERNFSDDTLVSKGGVYIVCPGALLSNDNHTNINTGIISVTPITANEPYTLTVPYIIPFTTTQNITVDTAVLPVKITMNSGLPQSEANVKVRIEGPGVSILNVNSMQVGNTDGSRLTVFDAVIQALEENNIDYQNSGSYIYSIGGVSAGIYEGNGGWVYTFPDDPQYLNGYKYANAMDMELLSNHKDILIYYINSNGSTIYPIISTTKNEDKSITVSAKKYDYGASTPNLPIENADVFWSFGTEHEYVTITNASGEAIIPATAAAIGSHTLQVTKMTDNGPDIIPLPPGYTIVVSESGTSTTTPVVTESKAYLTVSGPSGTLKSRAGINWYRGMTALSLLQQSGLAISYDSSGTYVQGINGIEEFDYGAKSGWLYSVNGVTPPVTAANRYSIKADDEVVWYYTKDFTKDASSSAWVTENQAGAVQDGLVSITTDVKAVTGSDGTAKATVSTTQLDTAVTDALKAAAASKDGAKPAVTIAIEADSKAQGVETVIPKAAFANLVNKGIQQMTIASPLGNMTLDLETLKDIVKGGAGDISLSIKKAEESQGRPVIRLEINNGGKAVGTFSKPITITVPYNPAASENEQGIAVFHLDENGQWKNIKASKYDGKNKTIVFRTNHFSDFVIAYSHKTFGDIKGHWAQTPIEYLASRRIIQGMTEESFAPNGTITRAQFVTLLAGMAGADLSQYSLSRFNDVKDNAWYKGAVVWAAENGIVQGLQAADGSFWFNPNQNISRQDMAVVMMRYLAWAKEPAKETTKAIAFKDGSSIASYAKESVATMQKAGLINGRTTPDNQTVFDPAGKLTRAEAAQILTNQLYQQF